MQKQYKLTDRFYIWSKHRERSMVPSDVWLNSDVPFVEKDMTCNVTNFRWDKDVKCL